MLNEKATATPYGNFVDKKMGRVRNLYVFEDMLAFVYIDTIMRL